jgi:hypothetical protein
LSKARARALEPWGERLAGLNDAVRDAAAAIQRHTAENFDALMAELDDLARAAAKDVDDALGEVHAAFLRREHVAAHVYSLLAAVGGRSAPNAVAMSRVEKIANACAAVLDNGGEAVPRMTRDPRVPQAGPIAEVGA